MVADPSGRLRRRSGALALTLLVAGCLGPAGRSEPESGAENTVTSEDQVAMVEAYLEALSTGDLDAAWTQVCDEGVLAADREAFTDHHAATLPRPVSWTVSEASSRGRTAGSVGAGRGTSTSWPQAEITFEDGRSGVLRIGYGYGGLCHVASSEDDADLTARVAVKP